jgi:hypothetical protein
MSGAYFGAGFGFLLALILAIKFPFLGNGSSSEILPWTQHVIRPEPVEKTMYFLTLIAATFGAAIGSRYDFKSSLTPCKKWLILLLGSVAVNYIAESALRSALILWPVIGCIFGLILCWLFLSRKNNKEKSLQQQFHDREDSHMFSLNGIKGQISAWLIMIALFVPSSFETVAAKIGMQSHVAGMLLGPALYARGGKIPGLDYYCQYGVGIGTVWQFFLGNTASQAILNYVYVIILYSLVFSLALFYLCWWLFDSWKWALYCAFVFSALLFHTTMQFFDPSSFCLRYPLLIFVAVVYVIRRLNPGKLRWDGLLGLLLACSLLFNTETGIYMLLSVAACDVIDYRISVKSALGVFRVLCITATFFVGGLFLICKEAMFSENFLKSIIEPLVLFGSINFGAAPLRWNNIWRYDIGEWHCFYNIIAPGLAFAFIGSKISKTEERCSPKEILLVFFSIMGLLMMSKYVNMSLVALWHVNAIGIIVVVTWLIRIFITSQKEVKKELLWCLGLLTGVFLFFSGDTRNDSQYALRSWLYYPSLLRYAFLGTSSHVMLNGVANLPDPQDLSLITSRIKKGEDCRIIDIYDWTYLIETQTTPVAGYIPSQVMFTKNQLAISKKHFLGANYIFTLKENDPYYNNPFSSEIDEILKNYQFNQDGKRLRAYKKINAVP